MMGAKKVLTRLKEKTLDSFILKFEEIGECGLKELIKEFPSLVFRVSLDSSSIKRKIAVKRKEEI